MDTQRCQNHGPVRILVPLLEFNLLRQRRDPIMVGIVWAIYIDVERNSPAKRALFFLFAQCRCLEEFVSLLFTFS